jgi:hypothetical protein
MLVASSTYYPKSLCNTQTQKPSQHNAGSGMYYMHTMP